MDGRSLQFGHPGMQFLAGSWRGLQLAGRGYLSAESISLVLAERDDHTDKTIKQEVAQLQAA